MRQSKQSTDCCEVVFRSVAMNCFLALKIPLFTYESMKVMLIVIIAGVDSGKWGGLE